MTTQEINAMSVEELRAKFQDVCVAAYREMVLNEIGEANRVYDDFVRAAAAYGLDWSE